MSDFMQLHVSRRGALYSCECRKCGATLYTHEWVNADHNERRDAMEAGTLRCDECSSGSANPETFSLMGARYYAARYSANGFLDCTEWNYGTNRRALMRETRNLYCGD